MKKAAIKSPAQNLARAARLEGKARRLWDARTLPQSQQSIIANALWDKAQALRKANA